METPRDIIVGLSLLVIIVFMGIVVFPIQAAPKITFAPDCSFIKRGPFETIDRCIDERATCYITTNPQGTSISCVRN